MAKKRKPTQAEREELDRKIRIMAEKDRLIRDSLNLGFAPEGNYGVETNADPLYSPGKLYDEYRHIMNKGPAPTYTIKWEDEPLTGRPRYKFPIYDLIRVRNIGRTIYAMKPQGFRK